MSVDIEYLCMTTDPCQVVDTCRGVLHANRQYVFDRCPIWFETDMRSGLHLVQEASNSRAVVIQRRDK